MWYDIPEIKRKNKITDVAPELGYTPLKGRLKCLKNHCQEDSRDQLPVKINERRNSFHCTVCQEIKGDVIDFVCYYGKLSKYETLKFLAKRVGLKPISADDVKIVIEVYQYFLGLCHNIPRTCEKWLVNRGIPLVTAQEMKLGFISDYNAIADSMKKNFSSNILKLSGLFNNSGNLIFYVHRLIIPYLKNGKPIYIQGKSIDGRYAPQELFIRRSIIYPYNVDCVAHNRQIYICKGFMDTLTLISKGLNAVGIPENTNFKRRWLLILPRFDGHGDKVYIMHQEVSVWEVADVNMTDSLRLKQFV